MYAPCHVEGVAAWSLLDRTGQIPDLDQPGAPKNHLFIYLNYVYDVVVNDVNDDVNDVVVNDADDEVTSMTSSSSSVLDDLAPKNHNPQRTTGY